MDAIHKNKQDSTVDQIYIHFYPTAHISADKNHARRMLQNIKTVREILYL